MLRAMLASSILLCSLLVGPSAVAAEMRCSETDLPVSLGLFRQTVHGELCLPAGATPDTVQLLVHGGTYNRHYWDLPYDGGGYSYQRDMAARGFATFAIDCVGSGGSSQPLSALITGARQASVVHQVVGRLRSGVVGGVRFPKVVLVGHSMGSGIVALEASTHRDVDGVVLTGFSHSMDLVALTAVFVEGVRPAVLDPVLSVRGSDPGYVTTMPETRHLFHTPGAVEPGAVEADEAAKDQVPAEVVPDLLALAFLSTVTRSIDVPVLIANGSQDTLFCAYHCGSRERLLAAERPYFTSPLDVFLLPDAGHSLALSMGAATYRAAVADWLRTRF